MVTEALRAPPAAGVKVTPIEQLAPAGKLAPHLLVCEKSLLLVLPMVMAAPVKVRVAVPVLARPTICAALPVPTAWPPKLTLVAARGTAGVVPVLQGDGLSGRGSVVFPRLSKCAQRRIEKERPRERQAAGQEGTSKMSNFASAFVSPGETATK